MLHVGADLLRVAPHNLGQLRSVSFGIIYPKCHVEPYPRVQLLPPIGVQAASRRTRQSRHDKERPASDPGQVAERVGKDDATRQR